MLEREPGGRVERGEEAVGHVLVHLGEKPGVLLVEIGLGLGQDDDVPVHASGAGVTPAIWRPLARIAARSSGRPGPKFKPANSARSSQSEARRFMSSRIKARMQSLGVLYSPSATRP